jgi:transcription elongation factor Elf1
MAKSSARGFQPRNQPGKLTGSFQCPNCQKKGKFVLETSTATPMALTIALGCAQCGHAFEIIWPNS